MIFLSRKMFENKRLEMRVWLTVSSAIDRSEGRELTSRLTINSDLKEWCGWRSIRADFSKNTKRWTRDSECAHRFEEFAIKERKEMGW